MLNVVPASISALSRARISTAYRVVLLWLETWRRVGIMVGHDQFLKAVVVRGVSSQADEKR